MSRPLSGLLVVALEQAVAAPMCTCRLADAGARVIKVERPDGDFARGYDSLVHGESAYFVWLNRGKESVIVDLTRPADKALMEAMMGEQVASLEEAIHVIRAMWSGERGLHLDGQFYSLAGAQSGPVPAHQMGIWIGAGKPRMLSLIGRAADGWIPGGGLIPPAALAEGNERIDEAARAAGRDPKVIRRIVNMGHQPAEVVTALALDYGIDTFLISEDPGAMRQFMSEVAPTAREQVESRRFSSAH